jgi:hypothetical protein
LNVPKATVASTPITKTIATAARTKDFRGKYGSQFRERADDAPSRPWQPSPQMQAKRTEEEEESQ